MSGSTFTLFVRCGIWYADVRTPSGKRKKVTTKAKTRRAAMQVALAMQEEGRFDDDDANPSFWSCTRDWWTRDKYTYAKESIGSLRKYVSICSTGMLKYIAVFHDYRAVDYRALYDGDATTLLGTTSTRYLKSSERFCDSHPSTNSISMLRFS